MMTTHELTQHVIKYYYYYNDFTQVEICSLLPLATQTYIMQAHYDNEETDSQGN